MSLALKLALSPLLVAQALHTRASVPRLPEAAGAREGVVGRGARSLRLLIAGDSSAAGVGVTQQERALSGQLVPLIAARCDAQVHWALWARTGLTTAQTFELLRDAALLQADLAVVVTGVNDVVDQVPSSHAVRARERITNLLRNRGGAQHVVFCPLPPVHEFPSLPQPLRWMAGADARRHNRALREWVSLRHAAVGDVSTPRLDEVHLSRDNMADDGFHPGEPVYRAVAHALAAHIAEAVWPRLHLQAAARRGPAHKTD
jgi:lysophospholipase L1-like esterase